MRVTFAMFVTVLLLAAILAVAVMRAAEPNEPRLLISAAHAGNAQFCFPPPPVRPRVKSREPVDRFEHDQRKIA